MSDTAIYAIGAAVSIAAGCALAAGLVMVAAVLVKQACVYLLRYGLTFIRLCNWYYWNERMTREGLITMQTFYREQVALRKPKTLDDFDALDTAARNKEQEERATAHKEGAQHER